MRHMKQAGWNVIFVGLLISSLTAGPASPQERQDPRFLEAARKEAQVVWYTTMSSDHSKHYADRFHKKYPFVEPIVLRMGGGTLLNKILTEARAGKRSWDVAHGTADMVLPVMEKNLLAAYDSPERKMIDDDLKDARGYWTSTYVNPVVLGYNTTLVKSEEVPRSYDDLLSARWKGRKISIDDNYFTFLHGLIGMWGRDKAVAFFRKLVAQEPVVMGGTTMRVQLAAAGEFPLVLAYAPTIQGYAARRAPMDWVPLEPVVVSVTTTSLAEKAIHPNAAKLFIDFSLSREGQEALWDSQRIPVRRDVEPKPARLLRGYQRFVVHPDGYRNYDETVKIYTDILKGH
jgi:iron(III) transport system substrate-binding protein